MLRQGGAPRRQDHSMNLNETCPQGRTTMTQRNIYSYLRVEKSRQRVCDGKGRWAVDVDVGRQRHTCGAPLDCACNFLKDREESFPTVRFGLRLPHATDDVTRLLLSQPVDPEQQLVLFIPSFTPQVSILVLCGQSIAKSMAWGGRRIAALLADLTHSRSLAVMEAAATAFLSG
ncbi:hypothetical protein Nepgr_011145 [Nepenthes gracilis]|uniref:Uncharacterized protein n=1 Tax=Nepenthes gracilis TaxID=150966 RepID=A0AAD3SEN8_NEPGR|nr:hypothetical protein Nepgr_011145 [Nepenthes gracilis]